MGRDLSCSRFLIFLGNCKKSTFHKLPKNGDPYNFGKVSPGNKTLKLKCWLPNGPLQLGLTAHRVEGDPSMKGSSKDSLHPHPSLVIGCPSCSPLPLHQSVVMGNVIRAPQPITSRGTAVKRVQKWHSLLFFSHLSQN